MIKNYYDKVAKKFGGYQTPAKYCRQYLNGEPEKVFKEKLIKLSRKNKIALDVGCADGRFTLSIAPYFKKIIAIDISAEMLKNAKKLQKKQNIANVIFENIDAYKTNYPDNFFDLIYSRRGPGNYQESYRLLKPGGYFVQIDIGEKDCQEIKQVFGRGQGFGEWNNPKLQRNKKELTRVGFKIIYAKNFFYTEYYPTYKDLDVFLQGVPIFEDFDSKKDKKLLKSYANKFKTDFGIKLSRYRIVLVAKK